MNDEIKNLFEGEDFSQEFKDKVTAIIETELEDREAKIAEKLEAEYSDKAEEYKAYIKEELEKASEEYIEEQLVPSVNRYLEYAVQEYVKENKLAIESGLKVELAESFLSGLSGLAEQFNVKIPEGQDDLMVEMKEKLEKAEQRIDSILEEKDKLAEQIKTDKINRIVEKKVTDLTESQKEKFLRVVGKVQFIDENQFAASVDELYESYFPKADDSKLDESTGTTEDTEKVTVNETAESKWLNAIFSKV